MSYNNRNQLNPNVWDIRSNNQNYNGQQQQIPSLLNSLFQQQPINNGLMNPSHQFYNNSQNNYQQSQQPMGMMFNNNEQPPFNNRKYNNNNRVNRPGPAFSKRNNSAWENDMSNNIRFDNNYSRDSRDYDMRQPERNESSGPSGLKSTLERLKKKPTNVDPMEVKDKLLTKLKTMPTSDVKDLINNPKQQFRKTVLNIQAKQNFREQNRQKLRTLGNEGDIGEMDVDEAVDCRELPEFLKDLTKADSDNRSDENIDVVQKNLGTDFLSGSEMLLMTGFSLLGDNDEPQFEVPDIPPLPTEKEKPPPPPQENKISPKPIPPPESTKKDDRERFNFISFYQSPRDWEQEVEKSKNPDPPAPKEKEQELPTKKPEDNKETNLVSQTKIEICDYASGLRPMYSPIFEEVQKQFPIHEKSPATVISEKGVSPLLNISKTPKPVSPPFFAGTPKSSSSQSDIKRSEKNETNSVASDKDKPVENQQPMLMEIKNESQGSEKRANETYGERRRRLAAEQQKQFEDRRDRVEDSIQDKSVTPPPPKKQKGPQNNQNPPRDRNWVNNSRWGRNDRNNSNQQRNNYQKNNNNNDNNRKSRIDLMDREKSRDRDSDRRWNNSFGDRSISNNRDRDTREINDKSSNNANMNRSFDRNTRERTPQNLSPTRDFEESSYVPANDFRPCYYTVKKIMEIDAEMTKVHEKIHSLDIIIQGHHSERVIHQKSFNKLQHERKVLFDNLMKRASKSERSKSSETRDVSLMSNSGSKHDREKKNLYVDNRKKTQDDIYKKILEPKSAEENAESALEKQRAEKAAKLQKEQEKREKEERERKKRIEEIKRKKLLRKQRAEEERIRLDRKICQEEVIKYSTTIKTEPRDSSNDRKRQKSTDPQKSTDRPKSVDRSKSIESQKSVDRHKSVANKSTEESNEKSAKVFEKEIFNVDSYIIRECSVKLNRLTIPENEIEKFLLEGVVDIDAIDQTPPKEAPIEPTVSDEPINKTLPHHDKENGEAVDEENAKPSQEGEAVDVKIEQVSDDQKDEYNEWTGNFNSHDSAIVHLQVAEGKFLLAACQDGNVLKYNILDGSLVAEFKEHKQICNAILYDNSKYVYSVSSDGFLHQINFETFDLKSFEDFREPLQVIEKSKMSIFVGSKNGNIYRIQHDLIVKPDMALCEIGAMVYCIKTCREGSRDVLLVSPKNQAIQIRDANDGLLLRIIHDSPANLIVFDILIDGGTIYCGSNGPEIKAIDFTNGALKKSHTSGKGTICLKMYKSYLIAACYDGNIYVFNTENGESTNICGPSPMEILAMDLWDDKIVATTKDKTLKIIKIPF